MPYEVTTIGLDAPVPAGAEEHRAIVPSITWLGVQVSLPIVIFKVFMSTKPIPPTRCTVDPVVDVVAGVTLEIVGRLLGTHPLPVGVEVM